MNTSIFCECSVQDYSGVIDAAFGIITLEYGVLFLSFQDSLAVVCMYQRHTSPFTEAAASVKIMYLFFDVIFKNKLKQILIHL